MLVALYQMVWTGLGSSCVLYADQIDTGHLKWDTEKIIPEIAIKSYDAKYYKVLLVTIYMKMHVHVTNFR